MVFRNIAVSGRIAVGSSSLANALAKRLDWSVRDGGQIFREISQLMGFDLETAPQKYGREIDLEVDRATADILTNKQKKAVVSKLAGFLSRDIEGVLRVLVVCPLEVRLERYSRDRGFLFEQAADLVKIREESDQKKWQQIYGRQDFFDPANFHLVIDSGRLSVEEEVRLVLRHLNSA